MKSETIKTEPESEKVKNEPKSDEESKVAVKEEPSHEYSDDDIPLVMIAMHFIYRVNVNLFIKTQKVKRFSVLSANVLKMRRFSHDILLKYAVHVNVTQVEIGRAHV